MRCRITKPQTLKKLGERIGRQVVSALTRGGTEHRIDVRDIDGLGWSIYRDGTIDRCEPMDAPRVTCETARTLANE